VRDEYHHPPHTWEECTWLARFAPSPLTRYGYPFMPKPLIHTIMQHMTERLVHSSLPTHIKGTLTPTSYTSFVHAKSSPPLSAQQQHFLLLVASRGHTHREFTEGEGRATHAVVSVRPSVLACKRHPLWFHGLWWRGRGRPVHRSLTRCRRKRRNGRSTSR